MPHVVCDTGVTRVPPLARIGSWELVLRERARRVLLGLLQARLSLVVCTEFRGAFTDATLRVRNASPLLMLSERPSVAIGTRKMLHASHVRIA